MFTEEHTGDEIDFGHLKSLLDSAPECQLNNAIVNAPFVFTLAAAHMFLGVIVLLVVNDKDDTIDRIAITDNTIAKRTKQKSAKPFEEIRIPIEHTENVIARAIATGEPQTTTDWYYLFTPELTPEQARYNQSDGGIGCSAVYPLLGAKKGALIFSYYRNHLEDAQYDFMKQYTELIASHLSA